MGTLWVECFDPIFRGLAWNCLCVGDWNHRSSRKSLGQTDLELHDHLLPTAYPLSLHPNINVRHH